MAISIRRALAITRSLAEATLPAIQRTSSIIRHIISDRFSTRVIRFSPVVDPAKARAASQEYPEELAATYLQLPTLDLRIPELAHRITASADNPYDKSLALEAYLRRNFRYTLNLRGSSGKDPLAHFLFESHAGHCEYFASAMTVMLRTQGIPSREVNGFLPGEYNDIAGDISFAEAMRTAGSKHIFRETVGLPLTPRRPDLIRMLVFSRG